MAHPFLKWAGGKRQLIGIIDAHLPDSIRGGEISQFVEPFIGGGALFFHVRQNYAINEFHISDLNPDLINSYLVLRDGLTSLLGILEEISDKYIPLDADGRSQLFYQIRSECKCQQGGPEL